LTSNDSRENFIQNSLGMRKKTRIPELRTVKCRLSELIRTKPYSDER